MSAAERLTDEDVERIARRLAEVLREASPALLTRHQAARAMNVSLSTFDRAVAQGCPFVPAGNQRRFELGAVRAFFESRGREPLRKHAENLPAALLRRVGLKRA